MESEWYLPKIVNINTATLEELVWFLPDLSYQEAQKIIHVRECVGYFNCWEHLQYVFGDLYSENPVFQQLSLDGIISLKV